MKNRNSIFGVMGKVFAFLWSSKAFEAQFDIDFLLSLVFSWKPSNRNREWLLVNFMKDLITQQQHQQQKKAFNFVGENFIRCVKVKSEEQQEQNPSE